MKRYRTLALVVVFVLIAGLVVVRRSRVSAQTVNVKVTPSTVSRVVLVRINPGQRPAFDQDIMGNFVPIWEEEKKAGIINGYQLFNNVTLDNPNDWNVGLLINYSNYAALDGLGDRVDPIELKHYGSAAKRQAAAEHRNQIGTIVSNRLIRMVSYNPGTPAS